MEILPHILAKSVRQNETKKHQLMKSDCGLIEGEFVNTRVLQGFFM